MIQTKRLNVVLCGPQEARAAINAMSPEDRAQVSPQWLANLEAAIEPDPWLHGFTLVLKETGDAVGTAGFKNPPTADGAVEIAYGIHPEHQGKGYATEAAEALTHWALQDPGVQVVRAHTLRERNASTRVLTKCSFEFIGEVIEHDDGPVWRWERGK